MIGYSATRGHRFFGAACKVRHHYYYGIEEKERRRKFCSEGQTEEIEYLLYLQ